MLPATTGRVINFEADIHLEISTVSVRCRACLVLFSLIEPVNAELDRLNRANILEPVYPIHSRVEWASPMVPVLKPDNCERICDNFKRTINPHVIWKNMPYQPLKK